MTKSLDTLVSDIYSIFDRQNPELDEDVVEKFSKRMSDMLRRRLSETRGEVPRTERLRMSNIGTPCERKLWYTVNAPELAEPIAPHTRIKFLYGDIVEELILFLCEIAGHDVKGTQDAMQLEGVTGHRDAVLDGVTVDVKSANSRGFVKFKEHLLEYDDPFGYLSQLGAYVAADQDDQVRKGQGAFVAVDKELGHIVVDTYNFPRRDYYEALIRHKKEMVDGPLPPRHYSDEPDGKSGNMKLCMECRYCPYKEECWKDANNGRGLRKFIYSDGPRWLTKVLRLPNVFEDTSHSS
jgi:hypothetical protein